MFHVELRRDGKLVSSTSHSFTSLGKYQYVSKLALPAGQATITVRRQDWTVELGGSEETEYLVTLHMPEYGKSSLHMIAVEDLRAVGIDDPPAWLPYLGKAAPESS